MGGFPDRGPMMKSGRFAALCGTSKATLRHYRELGLLVPAARLGNGYSAYSPMQAADFKLIEALASSGCSLSAIGEYLAAPDAGVLEGAISSCIESLAARREELLGRQAVLERTLERARRLDAWAAGGSPWRTELCEEELFCESDISPALCGDDAVEAAAAMGEALSMAPFSPIQGTYRIDRAAFLEGDYARGMHVCRRAPGSPEAGEPRTKPAGTYLKHLRETTLAAEAAAASPVFAEYDAVRRYIDEHGLETEGDLYEEELSVYSGNADGPVFSEISIMLA